MNENKKGSSPLSDNEMILDLKKKKKLLEMDMESMRSEMVRTFHIVHSCY